VLHTNEAKLIRAYGLFIGRKLEPSCNSTLLVTLLQP
jgi:hypothetical protein